MSKGGLHTRLREITHAYDLQKLIPFSYGVSFFLPPRRTLLTVGLYFFCGEAGQAHLAEKYMAEYSSSKWLDRQHV